MAWCDCIHHQHSPPQSLTQREHQTAFKAATATGAARVLGPQASSPVKHTHTAQLPNTLPVPHAHTNTVADTQSPTPSAHTFTKQGD